MTQEYLKYIADIKRYSPRTQEIYRDVLERYASFVEMPAADALTPQLVRSYEARLMADGMKPATVHQHLSVLSGFAKFLIKKDCLEANPVRIVHKPKTAKRLPVHYREEEMDKYMAESQWQASAENLDLLLSYGSIKDKAAKDLYEQRLRRLIIGLLYGTGVRRAELIGLQMQSFDASRGILHVLGKGDKMRDIPIISSLCEEISLYLKAAKMVCAERTPSSPLLVTPNGTKLYPEYVDRAVKAELDKAGIQGRKSPHALRHTLATSLLEDGADLTSIKEVLGHASLAATQVYTHATVERLKTVYVNAHPRAKNSNNHD
jgi:integrase/recombinase XerC